MEKLYSKKYWFNFIIFLIILLGISLRLKGFWANPSMWHDEFSLATSIINRSFIGLLSPLENGQCAPVIFMILTKTLTLFTKSNEIGFKIIPMISSIASIFVFYFLSKKMFNKSYSVIIALIFFTINYNLIYYSQIFKQYSSDVLLVICTFLIFSNINFNNSSIKNVIKIVLISILLILSSFPTTFIIAASLIYALKNLEKNGIKKVLIYIIPMLLFSLLYYIFILLPNKQSQINMYANYWDSGFLYLNINNFLYMLKDNFDFFFFPNNFTLIAILLFIIGIWQIIKEKNKVGIICILTILLSLFVSFLHIYPIKERVALYLIPILILIILKPIDTITKKKLNIILIFLLTLTYFSKYNFQYFNKLIKQNIVIPSEFPREIMNILSENSKANDIIFINNASNPEFEYYSHYYNLPNNKIKEVLTSKPDAHYIELLNQLPKNRYYWFYLPYDFSHTPVIPTLIMWTKSHGNVIKLYKKKSSVLIYVYLY